MSTMTQESISAEIKALSIKEKLHVAAGLLNAPRPDMVRMAESIVRMALQEIEAARIAREARPS